MQMKHILFGFLCLLCFMPLTRVYAADTDYALKFSSPNAMSIRPDWSDVLGDLEYTFDNGVTWESMPRWNTLQIPANISCCYIRGKNNDHVSYPSCTWGIEGTDISCTGNVETLLDWEVVKQGEHPEMSDYCFNGLFSGCTGLIQAPELPATKLAKGCYAYMFEGCTNLKQAPILPATTLAEDCYNHMFEGCTSLEQIPTLSASTLELGCYCEMFKNCTNLKLSETQGEDYPYEYNLGDLYFNSADLEEYEYYWYNTPYDYMFDGTGGTFTGTPEPNKSYYLNYKPLNANQMVEIPANLPNVEKKDNIPNTSLDDRDKKSACEVIANVYYAYYVSMPATLTLSPSEETNVYVSDYKVKAKTKTDGLSGKYIKVSPEHSIDLINENKGNTVPLTIEQDKKYFGENNSSEVVKVYADKWVETKGRIKSTITEQGNYKGNFKFEYGLVDNID